MNIKASARAALIIVTAFWVCGSSPVRAAADGDGAAAQAEAAPGAPVALAKFRKIRHWKHAALQRKPVKDAAAPLTDRRRTSRSKTPRNNRTVALAVADAGAPATLPSSIANARAQLADADLSADGAMLLSQSRDRLQSMAANDADTAPAAGADTGLVAADELNELDRALSEAKPEDKPPAVTPAAPTAAAAPAPVAAAASTDDSSWGQASLIGKIFIAFGGLLTLASAARMLMT